jgi:hypothetical protein
MKNESYASLKNFTVSKAILSKDKRTIELIGNYIGQPQTKLYLFAEGDCCSESYFWSFIIRDLNYDWESRTIVECNDPLEVPITESSTQGVDIIYPIVFYNNYGHSILEIVLRNSSNGYYYGWMSILEQNHPMLKGLKFDI